MSTSRQPSMPPICELINLVDTQSRIVFLSSWMSLFYAPPTSPDSRESSPKNKKESMDTTLIKREDVVSE